MFGELKEMNHGCWNAIATGSSISVWELQLTAPAWQSERIADLVSNITSLRKEQDSKFGGSFPLSASSFCTVIKVNIYPHGYIHTHTEN
jgi:hypothetical protein